MEKTFNKKVGKAAVQVIVYIVLGLLALTTLFPYFWMLMTSFKTDAEAISLTLKIFPQAFKFDTYVEIWEAVPLVNGFFNTLAIEVAVIVVGTFVSALAAFAFSKLRLPHKNVLLLVLMSSMMVPYAALLLPQYQAFYKLNLVNTLWPLILPGFFGNVTMIFFFKQYMQGIPSALFESAKIDGAGYMQMFTRIMLPNIAPALATQIIFWFLGIWNDYFAPSIYLTDSKVMTLQAMLQLLNSNNAGGSHLPIIMTGAVLSSIPMLVLYLAFQKYFIQSVAVSGLKE